MPKIKSITAKNFKRFTDLTVTDIPETARLVVLLGSNGCGKSSIFDLFIVQNVMNKNYHPESGYYNKSGAAPTNIEFDAALKNTKVEFHEEMNLRALRTLKTKKAFYFRSSYRHESPSREYSLKSVANALDDEKSPYAMTYSDSRINDNYMRIVSGAVAMIYDPTNKDRKVSEIQESTIGRVRRSMNNVFGKDLMLDNLGDPLAGGAFTFSKGTSYNYDYKNLSGGESAAFDLLLDFIIKTESFDDTVFCVEEPELHIHTRLHGPLLEELCNLLPSDHCQLWISTHSIGVIRKALELYNRNPEQVVFLDFDGLDFDQPQTITPAKVDRALWKKAFGVALHDLAELVAPQNIIICEGKPSTMGSGNDKNAAFDAQAYNTIFASSHPDTLFVSAGSCNDVVKDSIKLAAALKGVVPGVKFTTLVDRDNNSEEQMKALRNEGRKVLSRYSIENFLWSDEILRKLLETERCSVGEEKKILDLKTTSVKRPAGASEEPLEYVKDIVGQLYSECRKISALKGHGTNPNEFALSALIPLITEDTDTYKQLETDIFR